MDEVIYNAAMLLFFLASVALIAGLIKPKLFSKFLKSKATRKHIILYSLSAIVIAGILGSIFEPESVKQARLAKENEAKIAEQQKFEEAQRLEEEEQAKADQEAKTGRLQHEKEEAERLAREAEAAKRLYWHEITGIVDGDTIKAKVDGKVETIRVLGIDAPENSTECFGSKATAKAKEFLNDKWVQLEDDGSQGERDKHGRLLRYVWFDEGTDFGRRLIEEGYAYEYTYGTPYNKQQQYKETQTHAEYWKHGLWSPDTCNGSKTIPKPKVQAAPTAPAPAPTTPAPAPAPRPSSNCDPNYSPCVPNVSGDLDCPDIGFMVRVIGSDPHRFDRNNDGYGCESYN